MKRNNENQLHTNESGWIRRWVSRSVLIRFKHWSFGLLTAGSIASGVSAAEPPLVELLPFGSEGIRTTSETPTDGDLTLEVVFVEFPDVVAKNRSVAHFDDLWAKISGNGELTMSLRRQGFKGNLNINIRKAWKKMPQKRSYYFQGKGEWKYQEYINDSGKLLGPGPFTSNSIAIVLQDKGANTTGVGAGGHTGLDIKGIRTMVTMNSDNYDASYRILLHEIGHCFGSPDHYPISGKIHQVGGYGMMADARGARNFLGWHQFRYGWLAQNRTKFLNKKGTYTVDLKKISNSVGESMIVIPDPKVYGKLWVIEIGQDILKESDFIAGNNNYLNREGERLIVYTVEAKPLPGLREVRLAFRTPPPSPAAHLTTEWLDAVSYVAGQNMTPKTATGGAPFGLNVKKKTSDGFQIEINLPNDLKGGVYTTPQDRFSPNGEYVLRFEADGNVVIYKTTPSPESYHWDAITKGKWFKEQNLSTRLSYENGTIKRVNKGDGTEFDKYVVKANISGPSYLGVNDKGAVEIFPLVQDPPKLTAISPATGSTLGGTSVTLTGTDFTGATSVIFGGAPATDLKVVSATTITCKTPSRIAGPLNVMVTTECGVNAANTLFTYEEPPPSPPTLTVIAPNTGSTAGGTVVTLTGTTFTGAMKVTFGGIAATSVRSVTATSITCNTPAGTAGARSVLVTTPGGTNAANTLFTYVAPPSLTSVSPNKDSTAGGTVVTLTGTNFTGATKVTFGGIAATSVRNVTATSITCNTPASTAGAKSVLVTTPGGTNATNTLFNYTTSDPTGTWAKRTSGTTKDLNAIAANSTTTVAVGGNSGMILRSTDGVTWAARKAITQDSNIIFNDVVWDSANFRFFAVGQDKTGLVNVGVIYSSPDGATWTRQYKTTASQSQLYGIASGNSGLVAVGNNATILESVNGTTWNLVTAPNLKTSDLIEDVAFGGGTWIITSRSTRVAIGPNRGKMFTSTNRTNWTERTAGLGVNIDKQFDTKIAYLSNRFVATGLNLQLLVSSDLGRTFTPTRTAKEYTPGLAYGANFYFAAGINTDDSNADIDLLSLDGTTWTRSKAPTTDDRNGAVFFKNTFITVGDAGSIWQSAFVTPGSPNNPPTLTSVAPNIGSTAGGTNVTLTGTNFTGATSVTFGGTAATNPVLVNSTTISCVTPAGVAGSSSVLVTTSDGTNAENTLFTYVSPPTDRFSPNGAFVLRFQSDGNLVVRRTSPDAYFWDAITSANWFSGVVANFFFSYQDGIIQRINRNTGTVIDEYVIQANVSGCSYIGVNNAGGVDIFSCDPPTLTSVTPSTGSTAGSTNVTLTGTNFTGATSVTFGGTAAISFNVVNATTISCTTPARNAGAASVLVTTPGGTNAANALFTYITPLAPQPFLHLPMDGNTLDVSGNNRNGTASGSLTYGPGVFGNAAIFDGNQKIDFDEFSINATNYTITGFFSTTSTALEKAICTLGDTIATIQVSPNTGNLRFIDRPGNGNAGGIAVVSPLGYQTGVFNHFAIRKSGTTSSIFVNGVEVISSTGTAGTFNGLTDFVIGQNSSASATRRYVGSLDEIRVYAAALSNPDIASLSFRPEQSLSSQPKQSLSFRPKQSLSSQPEQSLSFQPEQALSFQPEPFRVTAFTYNRSAGTVDLTFTSEFSVNYTIEASPNLQPQSWTSLLGGPVIGRAGITTVTGRALPLPVTDKLFLRVRRDLP